MIRICFVVVAVLGDVPALAQVAVWVAPGTPLVNLRRIADVPTTVAFRFETALNCGGVEVLPPFGEGVGMRTALVDAPVALFPSVLVAWTRNVYAVPLLRPLIVQVSGPLTHVHEPALGTETTV